MIKRITHLSVLAAPLFFYAQHTKTDTTSVGTIQEVSLQGTKSFRTKKSETVARLPLENLENPTVYSVVPKEVISETTAIDFNTAVATVPGVVVNNGVNDSGNDIFLRGFTSNASFRNGLAINPRTQTEISNIERIEVVKGPFRNFIWRYYGQIWRSRKYYYQKASGEIWRADYLYYG